MKRRNPLRKIRTFLEHLESNFHNPEKRTKEALEKTFPPKRMFSDIFSFCQNKHLIQTEYLDKQGPLRFYISLEGMEFLERQKQNDMGKESHKFQKQLVITSLILAMGVSVNAINQSNFSYKEIILPIFSVGTIALTLYVLISFFRRR